MDRTTALNEARSIGARTNQFVAKQESGQRLSAAEARQLATDARRLVDLVPVLKVERQPTADEIRSATATQVRDAVKRGINPGIKSEPAEMLPAPSGYDPFAGRVCSAPGKPGRFGKVGKCSRQASAVLRTFRPDTTSHDQSLESRKAVFNRELGLAAYGLGDGARPVVASGTTIGHLVEDPQGPPRDSDTFVCQWHSYAANHATPHPDDVPLEPEPAVSIPDVGTLEDLDQTRQWRVVTSDPWFVDITDGKSSALVRTAEYLEYLSDRGSLPKNGERL